METKHKGIRKQHRTSPSIIVSESPGITFPSDYMSKEDIEKLSGAVVTYNLKEGVTMEEHAYVRMVTCEQCGKNFKDDCGDSFCSTSCERQYETTEDDE